MNINFLNKKTYREKHVKKEKKGIVNKIQENLLGSKFRILNEKLYTMPSEEAFDYFKSNPEDFDIYHKGFVIQANKWPVNPNNLICDELRKEKYNNKVIADLGCGEAFIAQKLKNRKIYSFDLVKINEYITECDIKNVPLEKDSVDVGVFCLSLMGINFVEFIKEAKRIIKSNGLLYVAEILSRIVSIDKFVSVFEQLGFKLKKQIDIKNYFILFVFRLDKDNARNNEPEAAQNYGNILKPCIYKKR